MRISERRGAVWLRAPVLLVAAGIAGAGDAGSPASFPAEYRRWAVARSFLVGPEAKNFATAGGFHHYYANDKALEGFRTGQFADGSVVVDERLEARQEAGSTFEGPKKYVAVMVKETSQYPSTGGWGFNIFIGEDRTQGASASVRAKCFSCHGQRKDNDFVFSQFRE